ATQARTIPRLGRSSSSRQITHILLFRRRRRTDRAAIHSAVDHADEEFAVEPRVARQPCSCAGLQVKCHFGTALRGLNVMIVESRRWYGRFRTTIIFQILARDWSPHSSIP